MEDAFFGLHKDRTANVYTKWKINEGEFEISDEKSLEAIKKSIKDTAPELDQKDFKFNANRHRYLERHWRKFIGSLINPTYDKVSKYNFHDTLECLIRRMLQGEVQEKYKQFEIMEKNLEDLVLPGTTEFYQLPPEQQESIEELVTEDFDEILKRLEDKQDQMIRLLTSMQDITNKQDA